MRVEVVALAATILLAGCGLFPSLEHLGACVEGCPGAGGAAGGGAGTGGAAATSSGGAAAGGAGGGGAAGDPCAPPGDLGRPGVLVTPQGDKPAFCIDPYEVSFGELKTAIETHYTTVDALHAELTPECDTFWLGREPQPFTSSVLEAGMSAHENRPAVGANWCEARAYCRWAGKDLCGEAYAGIEPSPADLTSQWFRACSRNNEYTYSYDGFPGEHSCHDADSLPCEPYESLLDVDATDCPGGFEGLYNMSGNAWEWTGACAGVAGGDPCTVRGGGCHESEAASTCALKSERSRNHAEEDLAFRCCWSPAE